MRELNLKSQYGQDHDPIIECEQCLSLLRDPFPDSYEKEFKLAAYELEEENLIHKLADANSSMGFHAISPNDFFFCRTDVLFQKWNPKIDAYAIIKHMLSEESEQLSLAEIDKVFQRGPRRMNSAVAFLYTLELIEDDHDLMIDMSTNFILPWIRLSGRAMVEFSN